MDVPLHERGIPRTCSPAGSNRKKKFPAGQCGVPILRESRFCCRREPRNSPTDTGIQRVVDAGYRGHMSATEPRRGISLGSWKAMRGRGPPKNQEEEEGSGRFRAWAVLEDRARKGRCMCLFVNGDGETCSPRPTESKTSERAIQGT